MTLRGHSAERGSDAEMLLRSYADQLARADRFERMEINADRERRLGAEFLRLAQQAPGYQGFVARDVVVTVPARLWSSWLGEGDGAGEPRREGVEYWFNLPTRPDVDTGSRVYVVAHGKLRGYAPLHRTDPDPLSTSGRGVLLIRRGGAVAVTIPTPIKGFQGYRYRWWDRTAETPFPAWRTP